MTKPKLGELLLEAKVLTPDQLERALKLPRAPGQKLGQLLVERGLVSETLLTQVLSKQLSVPWVSLHHVEFSRPLLDLVPGEIADRYGLVPILVRSRRGEGDTVVVAMEDPLVDGAVESVGEVTGLRVKAMIASRTDVRAAIRIYYGFGPPLPVPAPIPAPEPSDPEVEEIAAELLETPAPTSVVAESREVPSEDESAVAIPAPSQLVPLSYDAVIPDEIHSFRADDGSEEFPLPEETDPSVPSSHGARLGHVRAETSNEPMEPEPATVPGDVLSLSRTLAAAAALNATSTGGVARKKRGRRVTLLDGTTVFVPERPGAEDNPGRERTTQELVATLRALSAGKSAEPGHVDWEPLVGALLSVLLRKRLVADWELVEELRKFAPKSGT